MNKEFELNGVKVELSKEKLEEMLKEFDKPKWTIKKDEYGWLYLCKNAENGRILFNSKYETKYFVTIFHNLVFNIATKLGYLATPEQILNNDKGKYQVYISNYYQRWMVGSIKTNVDGSFVIDTAEHAEEIAKLLNESTAIKEWLEYVKGDE